MAAAMDRSMTRIQAPRFPVTAASPAELYGEILPPARQSLDQPVLVVSVSVCTAHNN